MIQLAVNDFVRRQVEGSGKTYAKDLTFEEILNHASDRFASGYFKKGYRDGVVIVEAADDITSHFVCPYVKIDLGTELKAESVRRQEGVTDHQNGKMIDQQQHFRRGDRFASGYFKEGMNGVWLQVWTKPDDGFST